MDRRTFLRAVAAVPTVAALSRASSFVTPALAQQKEFAPRPGASGTRIKPRSITGPSQPAARSFQNGTLMPCHSSARKFGIAAQTCTLAIVPIGDAMQCGAIEM